VSETRRLEAHLTVEPSDRVTLHKLLASYRRNGTTNVVILSRVWSRADHVELSETLRAEFSALELVALRSTDSAAESVLSSAYTALYERRVEFLEDLFIQNGYAELGKFLLGTWTQPAQELCELTREGALGSVHRVLLSQELGGVIPELGNLEPSRVQWVWLALQLLQSDDAAAKSLGCQILADRVLPDSPACLNPLLAACKDPCTDVAASALVTLGLNYWRHGEIHNALRDRFLHGPPSLRPTVARAWSMCGWYAQYAVEILRSASGSEAEIEYFNRVANDIERA